jgi:hypothetical protein
VGGDDLGDNREAQSRAAALAGSILIEPHKAVEDSVPVFNGNSWPVVGDTEDRGAVAVIQTDIHTRLRVSDSIVEQVA